MYGWKLNSTAKALSLVCMGMALGGVGAWSHGPAVAAGPEQGRNQPPPQAQPAPPQNRPPQNPNTVYTNYEPVNGKGGEEVSGPYEVVKRWPQPVTEGWTINAETMYAESPDRIIATGRGTHKSPWTA